MSNACEHRWGKLGEGYTGPLCTLFPISYEPQVLFSFLNFFNLSIVDTGTYNSLKIKHLKNDGKNVWTPKYKFFWKMHFLELAIFSLSL